MDSNQQPQPSGHPEIVQIQVPARHTAHRTEYREPQPQGEHHYRNMIFDLWAIPLHDPEALLVMASTHLLTPAFIVSLGQFLFESGFTASSAIAFLCGALVLVAAGYAWAQCNQYPEIRNAVGVRLVLIIIGFCVGLGKT
jgi:hypothetical protein